MCFCVTKLVIKSSHYAMSQTGCDNVNIDLYTAPTSGGKYRINFHMSTICVNIH